MPNEFLILCFFEFIVIAVITCHGNKIYLNKWAVEINGGVRIANRIAYQHGFKNLGQIADLPDIYEFEHSKIHKRSLDPTLRHHHTLVRDLKVSWAEQLVAKKRVKRDTGALDVTKPYPLHIAFNDPLWHKMWFLDGGADGGYDMNVKRAWERGYSGKGVVVTILDDGIEYTHPDLKPNYDPLASKDVNGRDSDPIPRYDSRNENKHGTRCAGEVAAAANNSNCVVGVAFNANIGGVRMLDGDVSDAVEASALGHNPQHVDVYSASWGPDDNGKMVDGPARLARETFINGVLTGRKGKGSIFVWASGNGGSEKDSCACDGYTNSIFTLSVSSLSEHNRKPWYLEECASTLASTYSSGENYSERKIVTTDLHGACTEEHTGTSASAPLAAGLVALALQANPGLTWRDMQYITLRTASTKPFSDAQWVTNAVGRRVSHRYGYGLMDAEAMVLEAERWTSVPPQHICSTSDRKMKHDITGAGISFKLDTNGCEGTAHHVKYLEHVQAKISLQFSRRGDIQIYLTSPSGTTSKLLPQRTKDHDQGSFNDWPFMSVFYWGEDPSGTWTLDIENVGSDFNRGVIAKWQLIMYGTDIDPVRLKPPMKHPPIWNATESDTAENAITEETQHRITENSKPGSDAPMKISTNFPERIGGKDEDLGSGEVDEVIGENVFSSSPGTPGPDIMSTTIEIESSTSSTASSSSTTLSVTSLNPCHDECKPDAGCTGPYAIDCVVCKHYKLMPDGICVADCPLQSYFEEETRTCNMCDIPCLQCTGSDVTSQCLSCISGYLLVEDFGSCVIECPSGYFHYEDTFGHVCRQCAPECAECMNEETSCTSCQSGYSLDGDQCVVYCGDSEFKDSSGRCEPCHPSCYTCYGAGADHCSRCVEDLLFQNGTCVYHCDIGYYEVQSSDGVLCRQCHGTCADCIGGGAGDCLACMPPLIQLHGACLETCPFGHFLESGSSCYPCDASCESCYGPDVDECLSCATYDFLQEGYCLPTCTDHYFPYQMWTPDGERMGVCEACHPACRVCSGPLASDCLQCNHGLLLSQGECQTECAIDEYDGEDGICYVCHPACLSCAGAAKTDCTACKEPLLLLAGECLAVCPEGFYPHLRECFTCSRACLSCFGPTVEQCFSCSAGFVQYQGLCVDESVIYTIACHIHQYFDHQRGACEYCDDTCESCTGPSSNECLSCMSPDVYLSAYQQCLPCCAPDVTNECCICTEGQGTCQEDNYVSAHHHHVTPPVTSLRLDQSPVPTTVITTEIETPEREETSSPMYPLHSTLQEDTYAMQSTQSSEGDQPEHSTQSSVGYQSKTFETSLPSDISHSSIDVHHSATFVSHSTSSTRHPTSAHSDESSEHFSTHAQDLYPKSTASVSTTATTTTTKRPHKHRTHRPHKTRPTRKPHIESSTFTSPYSSIFDTTTTSANPDKTAISSASDLIRKHWVTALIFLGFVSVFIVAVFLLICGLCQARSNEQLCWNSHYYQPVPTLYQNGQAPKVMVTKIRCDYADEGEGGEALKKVEGTEQDGITYPMT